MIRWALFLLTVITNLFWAASSLVAGFVTWAQIVPKEVTCITCNQPEVQAALIKAASIGRSQIISTLPSVYLVSALALFNILVIAVLLFKYHRRTPPSR
jgi:hypothetical protein